MNSATAPMSPGFMMAPPVKKLRAGNTPQHGDQLLSDADDAIARRRAELRRIQQMRTTATPSGTQLSSTDALLARARTQLHGSAQPPMGTRPSPSLSANAAPPVIPSSETMLRVRHSDIFPSVPKGEDSSNGPPVPGGSAPPDGPPYKLSAAAVPMHHSGEKAPVARRLDVTFRDPPKPPPTRSKSAPPVRPPPPPPPRSGKHPTLQNSYLMPTDLAPPVITTPVASESASRQQAKVSVQEEPVFIENPVTEMSPYPAESVSGEELPDLDRSIQDAGRTPFPIKSEIQSQVKDAGHTPFPVNMGSQFQDAGHTPFPVNMGSIPTSTQDTPEEMPSSVGDTPATTRRELLRTMREYADTPGKPAVTAGAYLESPELRMQKEMARLEKEKKEALKQVTKLQEEVQRLQEQGKPDSSSKVDLMEVVTKADLEGDQAALEWARQQVMKSNRQVGFLSPLVRTPSRGSLTPALSGTPILRKRMPTPHPKLRRPNEPEGDRFFLLEAVECTAYEYFSDLALYVIRRPYGLETERDLWFGTGELPAKHYEKSADVQKVASFEIMARIAADNSLLVLYGDATVRHQTTDQGLWKDYGDINESAKPLGPILYIDADANEREYSLDAILEEMFAVRENYCSTLVSTADGLRSAREKAPQQAITEPVLSPPAAAPHPQPVVIVEEHIIKPPTSDACVGTEEFPLHVQNALLPVPPTTVDTKTKPKKEAKAYPPIPVSEDNSSSVMATFMTMLFSWIFSLLWNIFVRIPLRIVTTVIVMATSICILALLWLYVANDHGAQLMGAAMYMSNRPGIV